MIPPFPHAMEVDCTTFLCFSTSLFCIAVVCLASFWPYIQEKILKALENWKVRFFFSLIVTIIVSLYWALVEDVISWTLLHSPCNQSTLFFISCLGCFLLYIIDTHFIHKICLSWISLIVFLFFIVEGFYIYPCPYIPSLALGTIIFFYTYSCCLLLDNFFPFSNQKEDEKGEEKEIFLGRERMYVRIYSHIRKMALEGGGKTIAIYGRWGEGKTHLINYLKRRLSKDISEEKRHFDEEKNIYHGKFIIHTINVWKYKNIDEAWAGITNSIVTNISGSEYKIRKNLIHFFHKIVPDSSASKFTAIRHLFDIIYCENDYADVEDEESAIFADRLNGKLRSKKLLIIFDDIERADVNIIQNLLPLIDRLKKINNLLIICAISPREIYDLYIRTQHSEIELQGYLDKLFDFSFYIPKASPSTVKEMRDSLLSKKYRDCPLMQRFFKDYPLSFDTPRQLERVLATLARTEWMYFDYSNIKSRVKNDSYIEKLEYQSVFIVVILKTLYEYVIEEVAKERRDMMNLIEKYPKSLWIGPLDWKSSSDNMNKNEEQELNEWKGKYPQTYKACCSDDLLKSLLTCLCQFSTNKKEKLTSALNGDYAKRLSMRDWESLDFIEANKGHVNKPMKSMLADFFGSPHNIPENVQDAIQNMLSYALKNIEDDYHSQFIQSLFEKEIENDDLSPFLYDCFLPLFYFYVEKCQNQHIEKTLKIMINKMEFKRTERALKMLLHPIPVLGESRSRIHLANNLLDEDDWYIDENMNTQKGRAFSSIMNLLCESYTYQLTKEILNEESNKHVLNSENYTFLHVFHDDDKQKYVISFIQGVDKYVAEQTYWNNKSLKYLLGFLAMKSLWRELDFNKPILSLSARTWQIFNKLITKLIDMPEQYGERLTDAYLRKVGKECEDSRSFFEKYRREHDDGLVRLECEKGAKKLKECIEKIRQKAS